MALIASGCRRDQTSPAAAAISSDNTAASYFKTPFQDESQFIVESIVTDIAEMGCFAKLHALPKGVSVLAVETSASTVDTPIYEIRVTVPTGTIKSELTVNRPIWAPDLYASLSQAIFASLGLHKTAASGATANSDLLKSLLGLTAEKIESENENLSDALDANFQAPALHENAALLLGAFAFRESAGAFQDLRSPLCRMTAHLAMANALSGAAPYGPNGQVAEALLYTLMNNQADAMAKVGALDQSRPEIVTWARALYARNTHDFRPLAKITNRSLIESFEYFRACCASKEPGRSFGELPEAIATNCADPYRILFGFDSSVELGHILLDSAITREESEQDRVYRMSRARPLNSDERVSALNQLPERCFCLDGQSANIVRVIGWGQWAMFFQRHLCCAISVDFNMMQWMWGVPDDAYEFATNSDANFGGLRLYPFVRRLNATNAESYRTSIDQCYPVTRETPQLLSPALWMQICYPVDFAQFYQPFPDPHVDEWHRHDPPPGTAYAPLDRLNQGALIDRPDAVQLVEKMHAIAPYDWTMIHSLLRVKWHGKATYSQVEPFYRPVLDYDANTMTLAAEQLVDSPEQYEALMLKAGSSLPRAYLILADYIWDQGDQDKAVSYYEKGMDFEWDGVRAAANASRLIKYYFKKGQKAKAAAMADRAAEVYSNEGLTAKADYFELTGNYDEALAWYKKAAERYGSASGYDEFRQRYKDHMGKSPSDHYVPAGSKDPFPSGVQRVGLQDLRAAPTDGIVVGSENAETAKATLRKGDVIVAVNGIRIHNFEQYSYARNITLSSEMQLIYWRENQFHQIKAAPPDHEFGIRMPPYTP